MRDGRMYISRQQLLKASRRGPWSLLRIVRIVPLERMARHLGVEACGLRAAVSAMGHGGSARWMADHAPLTGEEFHETTAPAASWL